MHDISSNNNNNNNSSLSLPRGARASSRPCHHTRGPCANDHSYHTSRLANFICKWWESQGLKHDLRHMIFSLWIWELPRSKVPPRSNSAGRRGGQNTPHRAESPWQVRGDYFSIYLLLFVWLFLFDAVVYLQMIEDCFFHVFVAVTVFVSYFDFVVVGQNLLGRW